MPIFIRSMNVRNVNKISTLPCVSPTNLSTSVTTAPCPSASIHVIRHDWPPSSNDSPLTTIHVIRHDWPPSSNNSPSATIHVIRHDWPPSSNDSPLTTIHVIRHDWPPSSNNSPSATIHVIRHDWPPSSNNSPSATIHVIRHDWPPSSNDSPTKLHTTSSHFSICEELFVRGLQTYVFTWSESNSQPVCRWRTCGSLQSLLLSLIETQRMCSSWEEQTTSKCCWTTVR